MIIPVVVAGQTLHGAGSQGNAFLSIEAGKRFRLVNDVDGENISVD